MGGKKSTWKNAEIWIDKYKYVCICTYLNTFNSEYM